MTSSEIRKTFLKYFEDRGHRVVPSHSLLPSADPTLLFVNAGMVQFKDVFIGRRDPGYVRATTTQKCLRVSGKHNDLDEVGRTPRHHTFFEMLGNFSFGDYFKEGAITYGWDLITGVFGLDPKDLWVTVHPNDDEARRIWQTLVGVDPARILDDPDNFWSMGDTGPCGFCSEIHIDRGPTFPGESMAKPGHRFMELWNLVFMEFDRDEKGNLTRLPAPSIDTGMGLERIASVLNGVRTNYDTDLFQPLIQKMAQIAGVRYGDDPESDTALRVIADHARSTAFLIADGVYPENEGRGYVLRRLMRRALRFGHKLGVDRPFFTEICLSVEGVLGSAFGELASSREVIERVAGQEEDRFLRTLSSGMDLLTSAVNSAKEKGQKVLDGTTAFTLYDTHGFPVDLTEVVVAEAGMTVDMDGFSFAMEAQRARGRASWKKAGGQTLPAGFDDLPANSFVGYGQDEAKGSITMVARDGENVWFVTDSTPFYGESGGQVGDIGRAEAANGSWRIDVTATRKGASGAIVHIGNVVVGEPNVGDQCLLGVSAERRDRTRRNHSATHLLHRALRSVLGDHVRQRGSMVAPDRLRFDFSHSKALDDSEIAAVEELVQGWIIDDDLVETNEMAYDDAISAGALHFFEDKYGDRVRLVSMGGSKELCGGTHVDRTSTIGVFAVVSEGAVAGGVRRIEAVTGMDAWRHLRDGRDRLIRTGRIINAVPAEVEERVAKLTENLKSVRKELAQAKVQAVATNSGGTKDDVREVNGVKVMSVDAGELDRKAIRELADSLRGRIGSGLVLLTHSVDSKMMVALTVTADLVGRFPANKLLQDILQPFGGRGGGNDSLAQGAVETTEKADVILDALLNALRS